MFIFYCTAMMADHVIVASYVKWGFLRSTFYCCTENEINIYLKFDERKSLVECSEQAYSN